MFPSLKFLAGVSLAALVLAAPVRAETPTEGKEAPKPERGDRPRGERGGAGGQLQALLAQLNLTEDQQKSAEAIMVETKAEVQKIRDDKSLTREQKGPKLREIMQASLAKVTELLTPEQKEKLTQLQTEARAKRDGEGNGKRGPRDGENGAKNGPRDGENGAKRGPGDAGGKKAGGDR